MAESEGEFAGEDEERREGCTGDAGAGMAARFAAVLGQGAGERMTKQPDFAIVR